MAADDGGYREWFTGNLNLMASCGLMHPDCDGARPVRAAVGSLLPYIRTLEARIAALEGAAKAPRPKAPAKPRAPRKVKASG